MEKKPAFEVVAWNQRVGPRVYAGEARVDSGMTPKEAFLWGVRAALASIHGEQSRRHRAARARRQAPQALRDEAEAAFRKGRTCGEVEADHARRKAAGRPAVSASTVRRWYREMRDSGTLPKKGSTGE